jgi:hypothetical protein
MATTKTNIIKLNTETKNLLTDNTFLIKIAIGLFTLVLNISCLHLLFS